MNPPRTDTPVPPTSGDVVVPLRPKPPAYPAVSSVARPVIIEEDIVDYLVKAPVEQRWRILSRVAVATANEPAPVSSHPPPVEASSSPPPPSVRQPMVVVPAPTPQAIAAPPPSPPPAPSSRPQLELVDQTREVLTPPPPPPASVPASPSAAPPQVAPRPSPVPPRPTPSAAPPQHAAPAAPPASVAPPASASAAPPPFASAAPPSVSSQRLAYSAPPPPPAQVDHAEQLFEAMHELTMHESAQSGARFCLQVALAAVPSLAGLLHLRDPKSLELVVVHAEGPRAAELLRTRTLPIDPLVIRASRAGKAVVATYGAEPDAEKTKCSRHAFFDPWSVVVVPVMRNGQLLGMLEMVDPIDGNPQNEQAHAALGYIGERLGRFLADHPVEAMPAT